MHIINGNYGNATLALIQWAYEQSLKEVTVISVDTGWAASQWGLGVEQVQQYARILGFSVVVTKARVDFTRLVQDRQGFPSQKFQWCAGILKGLPLLNYLDEVDPRCVATILMGKRQRDLPAKAVLTEFIEESDHFGGRRVWHPLCHVSDADFYSLINRAGFIPLKHRSLECDPCIHNNKNDFQRLNSQDTAKIASLEEELNKTMFELPIAKMLQQARLQNMTVDENYQQQFYKSCGSPFGCGE